MSEKTGKRLKVLSTVVFCTQVVIFLALAFYFIKTDVIFSFVFAALALISAILLIPFVKIADAVCEAAERKDLAKEEKFSLTDMYSPAYIETVITDNVKIEDDDAVEDEYAADAETKQMQIVVKRASPMSEDFTREVGIERDIRPAFGADDGDEDDDELQSTVMLSSPSFNSVPKKPRESKLTISAGGLHTIAVKESGAVVVTGHNNYGQCNVEDWDNVIAVSAGSYHTAAIFEDGTCAAVGYNGNRQCDVGSWSGIRNIATGVAHTVGLCADGTCVATGDNTYGQCNVGDWTDIVEICAGYNCTAGLRSDGTVVAVGLNIEATAAKWSDIAKIAAGRLHLVGLKTDGCCVAMGNNSNGQCDVSRWSGIKEIAAGNYHTVGLSKDGTCIATGYNGYGQCNVHKWTGIKAISAGRNHTVALTKYGKVLAVGDNSNRQCETRDFEDICVSE